MKCIVIDNEKRQLASFTELVCQVHPLLVVKVFTNPHEAISESLEAVPRVMFIHVGVDDGDGMEIARWIKEGLQQIHVVFVTDTKQYAIEAFDIGATDYLIMPVERERLQRTFNRIYHDEPKNDQHLSVVNCFGNMYFVTPSFEGVQDVKWRTKKAQELFAYLLYRKTESVRKCFLVELLWPDANWEKGSTLLYSAMYQARKFLSELQLNVEIESSENHYRLLLGDLQYDVEIWENQVEQLSPINSQNCHEYIDVIYSYKGDFLDKLDYNWAEIEKNRLRTKWLKVINELSNYYWEQEKYYDLARVYYYIQKVCPTMEECYFYLMKVYAKLNYIEPVKVIYGNLKKMMRDEFSLEPKEEIVQWYLAWNNR